MLRLLPAGAKVAGWDFHPLENAALARRTPTSDGQPKYLKNPLLTFNIVFGFNASIPILSSRFISSAKYY